MRQLPKTLSLQDQADDLNEQLAIASGAVASGGASVSKPTEPAAGNDVPMHYHIGTPKVAEEGTRAIDGEPINEIKTPAVLAQEAKEKLYKLLRKSATNQNQLPATASLTCQ